MKASSLRPSPVSEGPKSWRLLTEDAFRGGEGEALKAEELLEGAEQLGLGLPGFWLFFGSIYVILC